MFNVVVTALFQSLYRPFSQLDFGFLEARERLLFVVYISLLTMHLIFWLCLLLEFIFLFLCIAFGFAAELSAFLDAVACIFKKFVEQKRCLQHQQSTSLPHHKSQAFGSAKELMSKQTFSNLVCWKAPGWLWSSASIAFFFVCHMLLLFWWLWTLLLHIQLVPIPHIGGY